MLRTVRIGGGIEPVDGAFELTGHVVVVDGRGQHQKLRFLQRVVDQLHVIVLDAPAVSSGMAVFAGPASMDVHAAHIKHRHGVAGLLRSLTEGGYHLAGQPFGTGASA